MNDPIVALLNGWAAAWGPYFLAAVVQNLVFLGLVFLVLRLLRTAPARTLSLIATIGVLKLLVPPFVPGGWLEQEAVGQIGQPAAGLLFPFVDVGGTEDGSGAGWTGGFSISALLMMIWASIALTRLGAGLMQSAQLALDVRGAVRVDDDELPREAGRRGMSVWKSPRIGLPLTMGIRPRRIFVPVSWDEWTPANRRAVLLHELAHVQRRDGVVQTAEIIARSLFFFLPPVTWLVRRLHGYREMACDDCSVPADPRARLDYSRFLCSLAESMLDRPPTTAPASTLARRKGELLDRVAYQVKEGVVTPISRKILFLTVAALLLAALPLSLVYGAKPKAPEAPAAPQAETEVVAPPAPLAEAAPGETVAPPAPEKEIKEGEKVIGKTGDADAPPPPPKKAIHVEMSGRGADLKVDGKLVGLEKLRTALEKSIQAQGGKQVVVLDGPGDTPMKALHAVQRELKDLGLNKVVYAGGLDRKLPMVLPPDEARKKLKQMPEKKLIRVKVDGEGVVRMNGKKVQGAHVAEMTRKLLAEDPHRVVVLHTESATTYGAFVQTLDAVKKGGAEKIAVADPKG